MDRPRAFPTVGSLRDPIIQPTSAKSLALSYQNGQPTEALQERRNKKSPVAVTKKTAA